MPTLYSYLNPVGVEIIAYVPISHEVITGTMLTKSCSSDRAQKLYVRRKPDTDSASDFLHYDSFSTLGWCKDYKDA